MPTVKHAKYVMHAASDNKVSKKPLLPIPPSTIETTTAYTKNMIVSHKHKMIFIKRMKIAGTSFEMALGRYCGTEDIITPLEANRGAMRQKRFGHNEGQNYKSPHKYNIRHNKIISMEPKAFAEHYPAARIKKYLPKEIWDSYLKVSIVRCPYDTLISYYYWMCRFPAKKPDSFESYAIDSGIDQVLDNYKKLHIDGKLATDFLIRFENFDEDIKKLEDLIDCKG
ncbi:MAG: sulfotransferase domain-containing protein, partial [Gammaproteobacteria bacterium]|nr:sulfotransferase domain-containing protein [Gammaproteobacteria bacterium]